MQLTNSFEWFEQLIGFKEKKWNYEMNTLPEIVIKNTGNFEAKSIKELKEKIKDKKQGTQKVLRFVFRKEKTKENEKFFDTSEMQYNSIEGTLFQVASNFNCMELGSSTRSAFSGKYITQLMLDCTQGPSAAGGAAFGSILRVAKHKEKEINLLEDTPLQPNNGKLNKINNFPNFDIDLIKVGIHTNVGANFCRSDYKFEYNPNNVKINQVYTSTCIYSNNFDNDNNLADILLNKAYEGTYLSGIITECPKIVLTLIGGGTFRNPMEIIIKNILENHRKYSQFLRDDCEVEIPIYYGSSQTFERHIKNFLADGDNIEIKIL